MHDLLTLPKLELPPLSLYIHIPWCIRKCPYCDFNSHKAGDQIPEEDYVSQLLIDFQQDIEWVQHREIQSIFFGGGTPSLMSPQVLDKLLKGLQQHIHFKNDIEITLEANPGTFEQKKFADFYALGIHRLSIGIQSFNQQHLNTLGRVHDQQQARQAIDMAKKAGYKNFNLDLMHGLPNQSWEQAFSDLHQAIRFEPNHISWYQLTIEPNTEFFKRPPKLPEDQTLWDIFEKGQQVLEENGYEQYEISAYAQKGRASQHNLNYWQFGDYIGIGAGAHSKITNLSSPSLPTMVRRWKLRQPTSYLSSSTFIAGENVIDLPQRPLEFLMNALRLKTGFSTSLFESRTGCLIDSIKQPLKQGIQKGLLYQNHNTIAPTPMGRQYLNNTLELFLE